MTKRNDIPNIIKEVGFDFSWDESKVWALNAPVEQIPIGELEWHFDIPFLWHRGGVYNLTPREVLNQPHLFLEEHERTMRADLSYPIDIMTNKGRWLILDGLHRLMKSYSEGHKEVKVRKISRDLIPSILKNG